MAKQIYLLHVCIPWPWPRTSNYRRVHARVITPCARWRLAREVVYHDLRVQSGIVTRDDRRIDVAFSSRCTSSRHSGVVARHPSGWGTSLLEGIFPLNEPIRARLFLLAPRPKSRRHHIIKGWAWFEAKGRATAQTDIPDHPWETARARCRRRKAGLLVAEFCAHISMRAPQRSLNTTQSFQRGKSFPIASYPISFLPPP